MRSVGFFYLLSYIALLGTGTFLQKLSLKHISAYQLEFIVALGMVIVAAPALYVTQKNFHIPTQSIPLAGLVGIMFAGGSLFFALALSKLPAGLASGISISYVVIVSLLSMLFLHESFNFWKVAGIVITLIGVGILYFYQ